MGVEISAKEGKNGIVARLEGLTYSGHVVGLVYGNNEPRYSIDLAQTILDATGNTEKAAWLVTCTGTEADRGSVAQWGAERRLHHSYRVEVFKDVASSEGNDDAFLDLTQFVLRSIGAYDFESLGTAAAGTQIRVLTLDYDGDRVGFGGRECYHAVYTLRLMNAAVLNT